ncbi:MAG: glycoside hydrolase family 9 protein, partial [Planctomycetota bacterium]
MNLLLSKRLTLALTIISHFTIISFLQTSQVKAESEKMNITPNYSFENDLSKIKTNLCNFGGWFPIGVVTEDGSSEIRIVEDIARTGKKSLRVTPNSRILKGTIYYSQYNAGEEVRKNITNKGISGTRTIALRLDQDILSCDASIWIRKATDQEITLKAIWYTRRNRIPFIKIAEQTVSQPVENENGWYKYSLHAVRCHTARQVQIAVVTKDTKPFYIDDAEIYFNRNPHVDILVDQLGYETKSNAKGIILQSSISLRQQPRSFSLINLENSTKVFTGKWKELGYFRQWDLYHWEGDFSVFTTPGSYVVETIINRKAYYSPPFEIRNNLLVSKTSEAAYRFFYYQRCGMSIPSFHGACHLDDARMPDGSYKDLAGGWHDAGDYNKYNGYTPESVYALVFAYDKRRDFFNQFDQDANGQADILDEAVWGAEFLEKCINPKTLDMIATIWGKPEKETDNTLKTGDERSVRGNMVNASACTPGFALLGKYIPKYLVTAERLHQKYGSNMQTILALYSATQNQTYRDAARKRAEVLLPTIDKINISCFRELSEYATAFPEDKLVSKIKLIAKMRLEELKIICNNPFKITKRRDDDGSF